MHHHIENAVPLAEGHGIQMQHPGASTRGITAPTEYPKDDAKSTREAHLRRLADAIAACEPADAAWLLSEGLRHLQPCARLPGAPFSELKSEYEDWAGWITPVERRIALRALLDASPEHDQRAVASFLARRFAE